MKNPVWYPADVTPAYDPRHYVTALDALNLPDPESGGCADWHTEPTWWRASPGESVVHAGIDCETPRLANTGPEPGVRDARDGWKLLGHPAGNHPDPVWAASHPRAILDLAYDHLSMDKAGTMVGGPIVIDLVHDWIWTPAQMQRLARWAAQAGRSNPWNHAQQTMWERWREQLVWSPDD